MFIPLSSGLVLFLVGLVEIKQCENKDFRVSRWVSRCSLGLLSFLYVELIVSTQPFQWYIYHFNSCSDMDCINVYTHLPYTEQLTNFMRLESSFLSQV